MALVTHLYFILSLPLSLSSAIAANILLSGNILPTNSHLSTRNTMFGISNDCNLVLIYNQNQRFQSNTMHRGTNCSLTLNDNGQLLIQSSDGSTIWSSSPPGKIGHYVALLHPDGHVAVYGPSIWSTSTARLIKGRSTSDGAELSYSPSARNLMFPSQVLYEDSKLANGEHVLAIKDDCNLELVKATAGVIWESGTKGRGINCFLRLDHRGQIAVLDDGFKVQWSSKAAEADGLYCLIVQNDGQAVVYGPVTWSTAS
ncbi:Mannose-specific lectin 2 [Platanthera zijinensis]|uniref:Mannose-specific lectin 2 n=1 Tax=Platanthera zijinensis TaxID=2320716 RepID=A0AAP0BW10_9ASPA